MLTTDQARNYLQAQYQDHLAGGDLDHLHAMVTGHLGRVAWVDPEGEIWTGTNHIDDYRLIPIAAHVQHEKGRM